MKLNKRKKRLYRKVNTKARGLRHDSGSHFRYVRSSWRESREQVYGSMYGKKKRGLDYTPLFRFLLSKVGQKWDRIFSEAKSRLDKTEPIFWLVSLSKDKITSSHFGVGENTYYSAMFVDDEGILQLVDPTLKASKMRPYCNCCTHTLNGEEFGGSPSHYY